MAIETNGIATELEAKIKVASSSSVTDDLAITKSRVYAIGGALSNPEDYIDNQCVKYSDIITTGTLYRWYFQNSPLLINPGTATTSSSIAPSIPYLLDAKFNSWAEPVNNWSHALYISYGEKMCAYYYDAYGYPVPLEDLTQTEYVKTYNYGDGHISFFSNCTPFPNSVIYATNYDTYYNSLPLNTSTFMYPDENNGVSALRLHFSGMPLTEFNSHKNILGTIGYHKDPNNLYNPKNYDCFANMKCGQQFYILLSAVNKSEQHSTRKLAITALVNGAIYKTDDDEIINWDDMTTIYLRYRVVNDLHSIYFSDDDKCYEKDIPIFKIVLTPFVQYYDITYFDCILIKFTRITDYSNIQTDYGLEIFGGTYITDISIDLNTGTAFYEETDNPTPITLYYNYDCAYLAGWQNAYNYNGDTDTIGLDSVSMYLIRFLDSIYDSGDAKDIDISDDDITDKSAIPLSYRYGKDGYNMEFLSSNNLKYFDCCLPNLKYPIKLVPYGHSCSEKFDAGFAISYLRSPVFFNEPFGTTYPLYYNDVLFTEFPYEAILLEKDSIHTTYFFSTDLISAKQYLNTYIKDLIGGSVTFDYIKTSVPYIVFYDPSTSNLGYDKGFIFAYFSKFIQEPDIIIDNFLNIFWDFGDGYWGIPEYMFFILPNVEKSNLVKVTNHPRAILVIIPLYEFGIEYLTFYGIDDFGQLYVYYKSYFYNYELTNDK